MSEKTVLLFVTCLTSETAAAFEAEQQENFNEELVTLCYCHADQTDQNVYSAVEEYRSKGIPHRIILHSTCNLQKIISLTKLLLVLIPREKIYYRKFIAGEELPVSMKKFLKFEDLEAEFRVPAMA